MLVTDHVAIGSSIRLDRMVTAIRGREPVCGGHWIPMHRDDGRWELEFLLPNGAYEVKVRAHWDTNTADFAFTMDVYGGESETEFSCDGVS